MEGFWNNGSGKPITGELKDAVAADFSVIPNNTMALAKITRIELVEKDTDYGHQKYYEFTWKIVSDEFINREVTQKVKCFVGTPTAIDRGLNMMKLLMKLCGVEITHDHEPSSKDLSPMLGKVLGIQIREWALPGKDGVMMEGNHVGEVHSKDGFKFVMGHKMESRQPSNTSTSNVGSAHEKALHDGLDDDIPF
jgi:hypothetical protein